MKEPFLRCLLAAAAFVCAGQSIGAEELSMSLAGTWRFRLDPENTGVAKHWFAEKLDDTVTLPGTTDTNQKGLLKDERAVDRLSRVWYWKGPAWYQREVTIPDTWRGKRITLLLERSKHTLVWVDQTFCGGEDTLSAPQVFDVTTPLTPGKHVLTLLIDNAKLPPVGPSHAVDDRTQTNWNGVVGKIELRATDPVWFDDIQVDPNAAKKQARVRATIGNITGKPATGRISIACASYNVAKPASFKTFTVPFEAPAKENVIEFTYEPGDEVPLWDEFQPAMLRLQLGLEAKAADQSFHDQESVAFGMRDFVRDGNQLLVNGKRVFLRGRLDCANYPLTGYAPMDKESWQRILSIAKDWGLNHVRFHSWCPPQAAFEVADELGIYFQAELPNKSSRFRAPESREAAVHNIDWLDVTATGPQKPLDEYAKREGELIFRAFGNHPSFAMFTLGNELGRSDAMFELVAHFKQTDPRHLHAQGSNNMHWAPSLAEGDDFWVTGKVAKDARPIRGAFSFTEGTRGHIEFRPPSTDFDYDASTSGVPVPLVSHEIGSFQVSPDYREIPKFTGPLRARNYEIFRERIEQAGMLDQAHDFMRASGALSAICYREDIEAGLRSQDLGGFQLLDIMDFPGQGTALVGLLNVFMENKGIIEPQAWRQFCCETVPLLRMKKYAWTTDETFVAKVQVAHHGPADIKAARVSWTLKESGRTVVNGTLPPCDLVAGKLTEVDLFATRLVNFMAPRKLEMTLAIEGTSYQNSYPIWVYPPKVDTAVPAAVLVSDSLADAKTQSHLAAGGRLLLVPKLDRLPHSVPGSFMTDYWSPMFGESARKRGGPLPPGTLGILCDPRHPALDAFPTEFHSNWQWWHLVKNSRPIILDETPREYRPIVQVIDNFARNHKLGLLAESKVGKGSVLICTIDLLAHQDKPEARQFLHSLLRYVSSPAFAPKAELDRSLLDKIFPASAP